MPSIGHLNTKHCQHERMDLLFLWSGLWLSLPITFLSTQSYKAAFLSWMIFLLSFLFIVCACNIGIWRKVRKRNIALQQQNRAASQNQRLTKTLLFVSAISVLSWLPLVIVNYLTFFQRVDIPNVFVDIINILNFSNSILNPFIYALRIPQFRQTLVLCCSRRQAEMNGQGKEERANMAAFLKPALQLRSSHPESMSSAAYLRQTKGYGYQAMIKLPVVYIQYSYIYCKYTASKWMKEYS